MWLSTPLALLGLGSLVYAWWRAVKFWIAPVQIVVERGHLWVWKGFRPFRRRECVDLTDVTDVGAEVERAHSDRDGFRVDQPTPEDRPPTWLVLHGRIERRGVCLIKFASLLDEPRRLFVIYAVKHAVAEARRADREAPPV